MYVTAIDNTFALKLCANNGLSQQKQLSFLQESHPTDRFVDFVSDPVGDGSSSKRVDSSSPGNRIDSSNAHSNECVSYASNTTSDVAAVDLSNYDPIIISTDPLNDSSSKRIYLKDFTLACDTIGQLDFSISELLAEQQNQDAVHEDSSSTNHCKCCLCRLSAESAAAHGFCIKIHPKMHRCRRGRGSKKNVQMKFQPRSVCEECIDAMICNTESKMVNKSRKFKCCFDSCPDQTRRHTKAALELHYLQHLSVKRFMCAFCEFTHNSKAQMRKHECKH